MRDRWALGDWACAGERVYGDMVGAAAEIGVGYQTLRHLSSVSRKIQLCRRRHNLSWAHHAEVASLSPEVGDGLLARAEAEGWSRNALREEARAVSEPERLRQRVAALERAATRADALPRDEVSRTRSRLRAEHRVVRDAARRMAGLVEALASSPALVDLHGNARAGAARDLRTLADAVAYDVNEVLKRIEAAAAVIGGAGPAPAPGPDVAATAPGPDTPDSGQVSA